MKTWQKKIRSTPLVKPSAQAGAVTVELAIVMVVLLLMIAGMFGFGRVFWYADALTKATRDGARLLSTWEFSTSTGISTGVVPTQTMTLNGANAANVSPQLVAGNVKVECLNSSFQPVNCNLTTTKPANVRVSITGFTVTLGEWFPFIGADGVIDYGDIGLAPHTTMRYMN